VLLFHGGKLTGGYLGVDLFFVLSGYLITSLLLLEATATGSIGLAGFWARRARRLLPALFLVLAFVALYAVVIAEPSELHRIRADALATIGYVANWRFVFGGFDYFALFEAPSPLSHTWSLAIEEQFYVVWPLVVVGVLALTRRRSRRTGAPARPARAMFWLSATLAVASAGWALVLWRWTHDPTRIYYGTDTRAAAILLGAALGAWTTWKGSAEHRSVRGAVDACGIVGAIVLAVAWARLSGAELYRGGLLVCGIAGLAVVAAAAQPHPGVLARVLGVRPLVALGLVSYGMYLWHWPLYLWLDAERVGLTGWPLLAIRMTVTLVVATASYRLVERPIRQGALSARTARWATPCAAAALILVTLLSTTGYVAPASAATAGTTDAQTAARRADRDPGARRLMVVGNSVAYFLAADGFSRLRVTPPLVTLNAGKYACAYPVGERLRVDDFSQGNAVLPCDAGVAAAARRFRPDVVLMMFSDSGSGQLLHHGRWLESCDAGYARWYRATLAAATRQFEAAGARVVLTTAPYSQVLGYDEEDKRQSDCTNEVFRAFARKHRDVRLIELGRFVCPSHATCRQKLHGAVLRVDGVHYRDAAARALARWMLPQLGLPGGR
jgi:peptidoglycan/LPS O-acetylase OafA/YrhL